MDRPTLHADPLVLRPFALSDAPAVAQIANDRSIYDKTLLLPFPYKEEHATAWIATHEENAAKARGLDWAITRDGVVMGSIGVTFSDRDGRTDPQRPREACLGFWLGAPYRGNGYCSLAARVVLAHVFDTLEVEKVISFHFVGNAASGRVLEKIGMRNLGVKPGLAKKGDRRVDCASFELGRAEWLGGTK